MSQSLAARRAKGIWQFSIAQLLVVISLVAVTCGLFRLDIGAGICALHLLVAVAVSTVRTRAAVTHRTQLWDALDLPDVVRKQETVRIAFDSLAVSLPAVFFFYVGLGLGLFVVAFLNQLAMASVYLRSGLFELVFGLFAVIVVFGSGGLCAIGWLWWTWPKSFFKAISNYSSPSAKTG